MGNSDRRLPDYLLALAIDVGCRCVSDISGTSLVTFNPAKPGRFAGG
jgi:hypothetical protein